RMTELLVRSECKPCELNPSRQPVRQTRPDLAVDGVRVRSHALLWQTQWPGPKLSEACVDRLASRSNDRCPLPVTRERRARLRRVRSARRLASRDAENEPLAPT